MFFDYMVSLFLIFNIKMFIASIDRTVVCFLFDSATLLNSFISSSRYFADSLGFSILTKIGYF